MARFPFRRFGIVPGRPPPPTGPSNTRKLEALAVRANEADVAARAMAEKLGFVADIYMKMAEGDREATPQLLQVNLSQARALMTRIHQLMGW